MSEPLRAESITPQQHADAERDAKIESLLLAGLDHYFSSDYAQAIDVWTRALFLDRNHARARAYIERARSALAEQQRESEELLHSGIAAFERGQIEAARELLNAAVQRGGAHEVALAFLTRIDRISAAAPAVPAVPFPSARPVIAPAQPAPSRNPTGRVIALVFAVAVVGAVSYAVASWDQIRARLPGFGVISERNAAPALPLQDPVAIPSTSEAAIERARALLEDGRGHDALRALDLVRPTDPRRVDADILKEKIQRELLGQRVR